MPVLPVVHLHPRDDAHSLAQCEVAFAAGADGVFLISHHGRDGAVARLAREVAARHGRTKVGVNFLGLDFEAAYDMALGADVGMVWTDRPGIAGNEAGPEALRVAEDLARTGDDAMTVFASVAFKYQPHEPDPGAAAVRARDLGMLPTTSGVGTGFAPDAGKLLAMRAALGGGPLAVASGMTPENVVDFGDVATHFLVATGVSVDDHTFDPIRLRTFVDVVRRTASS